VAWNDEILEVDDDPVKPARSAQTVAGQEEGQEENDAQQAPPR
jgi:hypothetical protein